MLRIMIKRWENGRWRTFHYPGEFALSTARKQLKIINSLLKQQDVQMVISACDFISINIYVHIYNF